METELKTLPLGLEEAASIHGLCNPGHIFHRDCTGIGHECMAGEGNKGCSFQINENEKPLENSDNDKTVTTCYFSELNCDHKLYRSDNLFFWFQVNLVIMM